MEIISIKDNDCIMSKTDNIDNKDRNEFDLEQIKQVEFELLKKFRDVCKENGFNYSLMGGTLLGAVRHGGFIPWDDDIDLIMPRPDYEKFVEYCKTHDTDFALMSDRTNDGYAYLFGKVMDKNTELVELVGNRNNVELGVFIDIFIYDGMGNTEEEAKKNFRKSSFLRELLVAYNWTKFFRSKTKAWYYEPIRFAFFLCSRLVSHKKLIKAVEKKYKDLDFYSCEYVGNLCSDKRELSIIKRSEIDTYTTLKFEGEEFSVFGGYETYLKNMFGDYMQLPPEDKRVTHHTFSVYKKENKN